jgi:molybdopterin-guanine dinucleotide biosynthesis protein A
MEQDTPLPAPPSRQRRGAVILCGGGSRRMGQDKAWLPFGKETMLQRVVRLAGEVAPIGNVVVVASAEQELPELPREVRILRDSMEDQGPLPAVIAGLRALLSTADVALVVSCDAPLLNPQAAAYLFDQLAGTRRADNGQSPDAVVPTEPSRMYPLFAVYRTSCSAALDVAMGINQLTGRGASLHGAVNAENYVNVLRLPIDELRSIDPELHSLLNCNTLEEYQAALAASEPPTGRQ